MRSEKGAISLYVLMSCLFFVFILSGVYISNLHKLQAQEKEVARIEENYSKSIKDYEDSREGIIVESGTGKSVGDVVSIKSTEGTKEEFYVISYDEQTKKAVAIAKYNLMIGNIYNKTTKTTTEIDTNTQYYGLQNKEMLGWNTGEEFKGVLSFYDNINAYWINNDEELLNNPYVYNENSNLAKYVKEYGKKIKIDEDTMKLRIPSYEEIDKIFAEKGKYTWIYTSSYWLGSAKTNRVEKVWRITMSNNGTFDSNLTCDYGTTLGIRPVIEFTIE